MHQATVELRQRHYDMTHYIAHLQTASLAALPADGAKVAMKDGTAAQASALFALAFLAGRDMMPLALGFKQRVYAF